MKKVFIVLLLLVNSGLAAWAQGVCHSDVVLRAKTPGGAIFPASFAKISVCTDQSCGTLVTPLYSDSSLTQTKTNPFNADINGNYTWCTVPGTFSEQRTYAGATVQFNGISLGAGSATGTVISFTAGNLPPLFTTNVATPNISPVLTFTLTNFAADGILQNATGALGPPTVIAIPSCANDGLHALVYPSHAWACETITGGGGGGGSGTVTNCTVAGALAYYAAPGTTVQCDINIKTDGGGHLSTSSVQTGVAGAAGYNAQGQGTAPNVSAICTALGANCYVQYAPVSISSSFGIVMHGIPGSGLIRHDLSGSIETESISELTGAVSTSGSNNTTWTNTGSCPAGQHVISINPSGVPQCSVDSGGGGGGVGQSNYPINFPVREDPVGLSLTAPGPTLTNSVSQTSIVGTSFNGRNIIPAGAMIPNAGGIKSLTIKAEGVISTSNVSPSLIFNLFIGGINLPNLNLPVVTSMSNSGWKVEISITIVNLTTIQYSGCATTFNNVNAALMQCFNANRTLSTLNFATDQAIDLKALWGEANAADTITLNTLTVIPGHIL